MIFKIVPLSESSKLDGNGFMGPDGWLPGDYGALESVYTLGSNWSPDGQFVLVVENEFDLVHAILEIK